MDTTLEPERTNSAHGRTLHKCIRLLPIAALIFFTNACALFRPAPVEAPPQIREWPGLNQIRAGVITPASLAAAFRPIDRFVLVSRAIAQQRRFLGKFRLDLNMIAAGEDALRLRGRHPGDQTTLFDLVALDDNLKIYLSTEKTFFEGPIPEAGSPFRQRFGVEPWDISSIITIGQRIAAGEFEVETERWSYVLKPLGETPDGLTRVEIDKATGLPREAQWRRGNLRWDVEYGSWGVYAGYGEAEKFLWLMPSELLIKSRRPRARITIMPNPSTQGPMYRIDQPLNRAFELPAPAGSRLGTLEDFDRILQ